MAAYDWGSPPINSTNNPPAAVASTGTLLAELDSTMLGTKDLTAGQKLIVDVNWLLGGDTNITWQCETCTSTALGAGVDFFYPKTPTGQTGQYRTRHELFKDYRVRARLTSSGPVAAAYIWAEKLT